MSGQQVVVLGAGHGRRMGTPKIFARAGGKTFLEHILSRCRETAHPVTLVIDPRHRGKVLKLLQALSFGEPQPFGEQQPSGQPQLVEADGTAPMMASLKAALEAGNFAEGLWCWPVDAPFLSAPGWVMAVEAAQSTPEVIWKPSSGGKTGHPVWFPGWAVPRILAGDWPNGLLGLLHECADQTYVLELEGEDLRDFNTPEQLASRAKPGEEMV